MGKKSKIIMGLATAAMIPAILTGCGHKEHDPKDEWKNDATHHWHECEGKKCEEKLDKAEHEATGTWVTTDTHHYKDCDDCGYDVGYAAHAYDQQTAASDYLKTAATATTKAVYYKSCICGKAGTETFEADKTTATITNLVMTGKTYDGTAVAAPTYNKNSDGTAVVEYKVKTADDNTYSTTAPINAGEYTVRVSTPETINYAAGVATKDFTIAKATTTLENVALPAEIVYGNDYSVNFTTNSNGAVSYEWYRGSMELVDKPTNAGHNYKVKVKIAETENYTAAESELINFVINPYVLQGYNTEVEYNGTNTHTISLDSVVSGMELVVTFDSKDVGAETTGVVVKIDGEPTNNYIVDTTTCSVNIVEKEVGLQWTAPNSLRFDLTEKVPTVVATGLIGEDVCDVVKNLSGDNVWYGSTFTYEATGLSNLNYKLPSNKVSPEYTITIDETASVGNAIDIGATNVYSPTENIMYASVTLEEGVYFFDYTNETQGVNFSFELYAKGEETTPIMEFDVEDENAQSTCFNIASEGEYYVKVVVDQVTQGDELRIRMDTHAEIDEYGFCVRCGEYQGDTIDIEEVVTLSLEKDEKAYYRFKYSYDKYYSRTFTSPLQSGDMKFYMVDNNGVFNILTFTDQAKDFGAPFDDYFYIVVTAGATFEDGTFTIHKHDTHA